MKTETVLKIEKKTGLKLILTGTEDDQTVAYFRVQTSTGFVVCEELVLEDTNTNRVYCGSVSQSIDTKLINKIIKE